jgi:hypothetical protein
VALFALTPMAPFAFPLAAFLAYTVVAQSRKLALCGIGLAVGYAAIDLYIEWKRS